MNANGICEATYYLWQKRIRQQTYEQMTENKPLLPATKNMEEITFAVLPIPQAKNVLKVNLPASSIHPVAVIKTDKLSIALSGDIPIAGEMCRCLSSKAWIKSVILSKRTADEN